MVHLRIKKDSELEFCSKTKCFRCADNKFLLQNDLTAMKEAHRKEGERESIIPFLRASIVFCCTV